MNKLEQWKNKGYELFSKPIKLSQLSHAHEQDCCERVYINWKSLNDTTFDSEKDYILGFKGVDNKGLKLLCSDGNTYFVAAYNIQEGYYSNKLTLMVKISEHKLETYDVSDFTEERET